MYDFTNKIAIITGAMGNLGAATVQIFQKAGAKIALVDRLEGRLQAKFLELAGSQNFFFAEGIDLTNTESVTRMVNAVLVRFGKIDVLVNTAGGFRGGKPVHETPLASWEYLINLNARTTLVACQAIVPQMISQNSGKIINVAARAALGGNANMGAYSASKAAVIRVTESLSAELKKYNINVNCIIPGTIDTPQNREAMPSSDFSRWVAPDKLAEVILFLASPAASAIHGAAIPVFGLS
ncbi:MAG TPA: SDR family NAD(P)-dependent oxidoreductase [Anaerolineales bacterium]|nr:SDR family NAD(P)-dependent oxidoreductase [Anaerolineales bacterium]